MKWSPSTGQHPARWPISRTHQELTHEGDHLKGWLVTRRFDRHTRTPPESDQQLHDRIRSRLGRVVSHPRSVEVHVENGRVHLGGHIFTKELDNLLSEVSHVAGVRSVHNELV